MQGNNAFHVAPVRLTTASRDPNSKFTKYMFYGMFCFMTKVLEIGAGCEPAIRLPGALLQEPATEYFAVDADPEKTERAFRQDTEAQAAYLACLRITEGAILPFDDRSIGHVIMRSVFGEYTMDPQFTGSSHENTFLTLYEAFRVLEVGGQIAIAEENTPEPPATADNIGATLLDAGFTDVVVYPCQSEQNPHWYRERTKYWGIKTQNGYTRGGPGASKDVGYLICGTRPDVETEEFEKPTALNSVWKRNMQRGWDHPDTEVWVKTERFQRSKRTLPVGYDEERKLIKMITKDGETDLATYMTQVAAGSTPALIY